MRRPPGGQGRRGLYLVDGEGKLTLLRSSWDMEFEPGFPKRDARTAEFEFPRNVFLFALNSRLDTLGATWGATTEGEQAPYVILGGTPLHSAAYRGEFVRVDSLLAEGVDPGARSTTGFTALEIALVLGHEDVALRLSRGAFLAVPGDSRPLGLAALYGHPGAIAALIEGGVDTNLTFPSGRTPLHLAVINLTWRDESVLQPVQFFAPTRELERQRYSIERMWDVVRALLDHGADPNRRDGEGRTPLHELASYPMWSEVQDNGRKKALVLEGELARVAELLLERGADPGARDSCGDTPLHVCASAALGPLIRAIAARSPSLEVPNDNGETPLQALVRSQWFHQGRPRKLRLDSNTIGAAKVLIELGAKADLPTLAGSTVRAIVERSS